MHIRYNSTSDLYEYLVSTGPDVWDTLPIDAAQLKSGIPALNGFKFPATQVSSADANTLDDYEEGTWTPVLGGAGGTSGQSYTTQFGNYLKIGKQVTAWFNITLSNKGTITGNLQINGLPFTIENVSGNFPQAIFGYWQSLAIALVHLTGFGNQNATTISIYGASAAAASLSALATANVNNTTQLIGSITYRATT